MDMEILATSRRRGRQICHLEGRFQKSVFGGDQRGGGVSGSVCSDKSPISERLPTVNRLVIEPAGMIRMTWEKEGERETLCAA
jgi:hypothetical protein